MISLPKEYTSRNAIFEYMQKNGVVSKGVHFQERAEFINKPVFIIKLEYPFIVFTTLKNLRYDSLTKNQGFAQHPLMLTVNFHAYQN